MGGAGRAVECVGQGDGQTDRCGRREIETKLKTIAAYSRDSCRFRYLKTLMVRMFQIKSKLWSF